MAFAIKNDIKDENMTDTKLRMQRMFTDREKKGEALYLLFFVLAVGTRAVGMYEGMPLLNIGLVACALLFLCKLLVSGHTKKECLVIGAFLLLAALVYVFSREKGLLLCFMMMLGMKNVNPRKVIGYGTMVAGLIIVFKIFIGVFGLSSEIYYPQERAGVGLMFRHALGYAHPNTLHMNVMMLTMMVIYLVTVFLKDRENGKILLCIASAGAFLFNLYIYNYSGSRTGVLSCAAYLVVNFWFYARKNLGLFEKIISYAAFPATAFVSIVLPHILPEDLFLLLNRTLFNSRFMLARYFWDNNGFSLFGRTLNNPDPLYRTYGIDMAQAYLFIQLGAVTFIAMFALTIFFINRCIVSDDRAELSVMIAMLVIGIWEPLLYNLSAKNFVYVFMGAAIYKFLDTEKEKSDSVEGACTACGEWASGIVTDKAYVKTLIRNIFVGVVIGVSASVLYVATTKEPTALYGMRARTESGNPLDMTPGYYTSQQIAKFKENGDIVVDYIGDDHPMYRYDEVIAGMEYHKMILSIGVWAGIAAFSGCQFVGAKRDKSCYNGSV